MSGQMNGQELDLSTLREGAESAAASGIPEADLLVRFADALVGHDDVELAALRGPIIEALGPEGFLEVAATAANFQRMVRIADGTGIPQEGAMVALSAEVVEELGLRDFGSAGNTPASSPSQRFAGRVLGQVVPRVAGLVTGFFGRRLGPDAKDRDVV